MHNNVHCYSIFHLYNVFDRIHLHLRHTLLSPSVPADVNALPSLSPSIFLPPLPFLLPPLVKQWILLGLLSGGWVRDYDLQKYEKLASDDTTEENVSPSPPQQLLATCRSLQRSGALWVPPPRNKIEFLLWWRLFNNILEVLAKAIRQEKEIKYRRSKKEKKSITRRKNKKPKIASKLWALIK